MDLILSISTSLLALLPLLLLVEVLLHRRSPPPTAANYRPSCYPIIGNLIAFLKNYHRFLDWASDLLSSSPTATIQVDGPFGLSHGVCTADPRNVEHLLRSNFPNYVKGQRTRTVLSDVLGHGIFNSDDDLWSSQRKIASREFTTRSLKSFVAETVAAEIRSRLIPLLSAAADKEEVIDLQDVLKRFGFDNICNLAFGTDPACLDLHQKPEPFVLAFDEAVKICSDRFYSPVSWLWKLKRFLNIGSERRLRNAIHLIDDYAMEIITRRENQEESERQEDLLSRFTGYDICNDGNGGGGGGERKEERRRFLRDIIISFVLAGKDSTSAALTWFFWLLTKNPNCERKLLDELREFEEFKNYDELKNLHYLHAAISESLRLCPPVPINSRVAVADDVLPDGTRVGAGWFADYSAYAMARSERVWGKDCKEYVPERWIDEKGEFVGVDAFKFPVFPAGPRMCLGREMAYVQMKSVAAAVLRRFVVEDAAAARVVPEYEMSLTMKMKGGFPVRIRRRGE